MEISITWNICRVCLVEEEKKPQMTNGIAAPMCHIFSEDKMLAQQIYECSGVTIKPDENLPEKICKKCFTFIKKAANFRKTCRASDTYLKNILESTKSASALFKRQPLSQDPLDDIINSDCLSIDNNEGDANSIETFEKRKGMHLEKASKKFKGREFSDFIELENESNVSENDIENSLAQNDILEYDESTTDEILPTAKYDGNEENPIALQLKSSPMPKLQLNEENEKETCFLEENQESETEDLKKNKDDAIFTCSEKEDEDNVESYEQIKEFVIHRERNRRNTTSDMESESEDSQARVSSTVAIKEIGNSEIDLKTEDTNLSSGTNDLQTEYIVDEYLMDDNSQDSISLQNSSVLVVHSKKDKSVLSKQLKHTDHSTNASSIRKPTKTGADLQLWICELCCNHFGNRQLLSSHMKVHRQEKNHECEICLKRFITACNLQAHMRIHTGEKPFECKYCGRRFSDRSSNLRHERTHTNEKPYECKECGKAFSLATTLKKHQTVHTEERLFSCDICEKAFKLPHQLKAHKNSTLHKAVEQLTQMNQ